MRGTRKGPKWPSETELAKFWAVQHVLDGFFAERSLTIGLYNREANNCGGAFDRTSSVANKFGTEIVRPHALATIRLPVVAKLN